jgi:energy-coupling factor transporter transmembrane protein EcfT
MLPTTPFGSVPDRTSRLSRLHPASKLAGLLLVLISCFMLPWWLVPLLLGLLLAALWQRGLTRRGLVGGLRPWWPVALLVLVVHALTTVSAAPLGHPSWSGLGRGIAALARVGGAVAGLALYLRITPLDELADGLAWWRRPWRRTTGDAGRLALVLMVALGTVPGVMAEGRRIAAVVRLRRGDVVAGRSLRTHWRRALDRAHLAVPLLEGLFRRADGLTLALQNRRPGPAQASGHPPAWQLLGLVAWSGALVFLRSV